MSLLLIISTIHFLIGGVSLFLINKKLSVEERRKNWLKYIFYLLIFVVVLASVLVNKNIFLGVSIIIFSICLLEILKLSKLPCTYILRDRFVFISIIIFSILALLFSIFILVPSVIIAYTYTVVIIFDGASQISGQIFGKRKIFPAISPNKTFEGLAGGILSAVITAVILHGFVSFSVTKALIFGLLICGVSFTGDFVSSIYKRAFSMKDFGNIIPGQGGMMDRFDSFITSGAVVGLISIFTFFSFRDADRNIAVYLGYSLTFILILLSGEMLQHIFKFKPEFSRAFSHMIAGIASLFMIKLFTSPWYIVSICIHSAIFMYISKRISMFHSHHGVERTTNGSPLFFMGILAAFLISEMQKNTSLFYLPVTILSISDPAASLAGLKSKSGLWSELFSGFKSSKTYLGSLVFFISAFIILIAGMALFYEFTSLKLIPLAIISGIITITELISPGGSDNLTIPLAASLTIALLVV
ncbi:MAG: phosphatidate cytidylyltransferase [Bacteroidia bacterium]|nr:phosphatidate cytidylyltransferase [Bacteroidia bacterium]